MQGHDIIVVGASAGGVEALITLAKGLPRDLPAAVFAVLHIPAQSPSLLPHILTRAGALPATQPADGEEIQQGHIYVAPPDCHLLVDSGYMRVVRGPKENRHRPAVDPLFRSAARAYGPRVVGIILTGALDDGTYGLMAVNKQGGIAVVQDPNDAYYPSMPRNALQYTRADYVLPMSDIPALLVELANTPVDVEEGAYSVPEEMEIEARIAAMESQPNAGDLDKIATPSAFACPECHGTLWEMHNGDLVRYRCRVGHAYSAESMLAEHTSSLESALWASLRALEESAALSERMAQRAREGNHPHLQARYTAKALETTRHAEVVRNILLENGKTSPEEEAQDAHDA